MKRLEKIAFVFIILSMLFYKDAISKDKNMDVWLESSLKRIFPQSPGKATDHLTLIVARNSRVSFQVGFHSNMKDRVEIACDVETEAVKHEVRYVGLVPFQNFNTDVREEELDGIGFLPGMLPDPLYPLTRVDANPYASRSFWVTLRIPENIEPGIHQCKVKVSWNEGKVNMEKTLLVDLNISKLIVQPRKNFHVTHWWRGEATWAQYKTEMYDEKWWQLTKAQMKNLIDHGNDVAFIQNLFELKTVFKKPCQMLIINETSPGKYSFDWSRIKRFVDMTKELGYKKFEWGHLFLYWGVENAMHVYTQKGDKYELLWDENLSATSPVYLNFLKQYLPEFHRFLKKENVLDDSYFHLSDEPGSEHIQNYKRARKILQELAPWMKVMDALSDVRYGREKLTDIPIPIISSAGDYLKENIPHWVYYCTGPRDQWLNRFYDTPLAKIRMSGFLFYHLKAQGFLHWGYNYWNVVEKEEPIDPFTNASGSAYPGIAAGDPFVVYPGPDGPYDSIRWEIFAESLQDYAILQSAGIKQDDPMLSEIKTYADFPKKEEWIDQTMKRILEK
ncbi:DUF4091 domain-containing protein [Pedobacter panaciterrae]|uniref:DUF4091 domain-containing protein n=1 Tax=Pedobacter panaciterrae TaxID=363849 RepID=UPI002599FA91|nr:DUF4091 domain-containing protein [uncultured Pedobacter sp.]